MAGDRLDDAIDAVVRAVDRIERATRPADPDAPAAQAGPASAADGAATPAGTFSSRPPAPQAFDEPVPPRASGGTTVPQDATRAVPGAIGSDRPFWAAREPSVATPAAPQPGEHPPASLAPPSSAGPTAPALAASTPGPEPRAEHPGASPASTAEFSALGAEHVGPLTHAGVAPEVHELVGRIVGGMQALEDHLAAASSLRSEINAQVARLAAVAGRAR